MSEANCKPLPHLSSTDIDRFWQYVDKRGPDECWPWTGARSDRGYGVFEMRTTTVRASRVAFAVQHGRDPYPSLIRHSCDFPPCSNGAHLLDGSHGENMKDAMDRGRIATGDSNGSRKHPDKLVRGSGHGMAKLNEELVVSIRERHANGEPSTDIAKNLDITFGTICRIVKGQAWEHAGGPISIGPQSVTGETHHAAKFTEDIVRDIREKRKQGRTFQSLATEYGVAIGAVFSLVSGKTWKHVK